MPKHVGNYVKSSPYGVAKADGGPYATKPQTNFDGGRATKLSGGNGSARQKNFDINTKISVKDATQGVRGTGSQGGY